MSLAYTGDNVQKWTWVFSTRRWVAWTCRNKEKKIACPLLDVVACWQVSIPRLYRLTGQFSKKRIHEILHIPDLWTKPDLWTIFWVMKNPQIGGTIFPNSFSTDFSVQSFIFEIFLKSREECRIFPSYNMGHVTWSNITFTNLDAAFFFVWFFTNWT